MRRLFDRIATTWSAGVRACEIKRVIPSTGTKPPRKFQMTIKSNVVSFFSYFTFLICTFVCIPLFYTVIIPDDPLSFGIGRPGHLRRIAPSVAGPAYARRSSPPMRAARAPAPDFASIAHRLRTLFFAADAPPLLGRSVQVLTFCLPTLRRSFRTDSWMSLLAAKSLAAGALPIGLAHGVTLKRDVSTTNDHLDKCGVATTASEAVRTRRDMEAKFKAAA